MMGLIPLFPTSVPRADPGNQLQPFPAEPGWNLRPSRYMQALSSDQLPEE